MKLLTSKIFWGLMLVLGGVILLLEQMGILEGSEVFWMLVCAVAGLFFLVALATNHSAWWAVIPGVSMLALALSIGLGIFTALPGEVIGAILLGGIGMSFFVVYVIQRIHWWAIIPGGVLLTLAGVAGMEGSDPGPVSGAIFFAGLGLTFALVALLPNKAGLMTWAWIPAGILLFLAALILAGIESLFNYIWPVAVIILGFYFLWRAFLARKHK